MTKCTNLVILQKIGIENLKLQLTVGYSISKSQRYNIGKIFSAKFFIIESVSISLRISNSVEIRKSPMRW